MATDISKFSRVLYVNSNGVNISSNVNITGNTLTVSNNLVLGASTLAANLSANGFSLLPNGLIMNWGTFNCNSASSVTFTAPYANTVLSISVMPRSNVLVAANTPFVFASNTTTANIYSAATSTSGANAYYIAIGF